MSGQDRPGTGPRGIESTDDPPPTCFGSTHNVDETRVPARVGWPNGFPVTRPGAPAKEEGLPDFPVSVPVSVSGSGVVSL